MFFWIFVLYIQEAGRSPRAPVTSHLFPPELHIYIFRVGDPYDPLFAIICYCHWEESFPEIFLHQFYGTVHASRDISPRPSDIAATSVNEGIGRCRLKFLLEGKAALKPWENYTPEN